MRRTLLAALAVALATALPFAGRIAITRATPARPGAVVVTMRFGAALRLSPSSDADIATIARCGATFSVADEQAGWFAVYAANQVLWVGGGRVADAETVAPDCTDAVGFQVNDFALANVQAGCLSVRAYPSRSAPYDHCVDDGHSLQIQNGPLAVDGEDWFQVWNDDIGTGWVLADFLVRARV